MAGRTIVQHKRTKKEQQDAFLPYLAEYASVTRACKKVKVPRQNIYDWLKADPAFKVKFDEACEIATAALEDEATRRAHEGTVKPVFQGGKKVGEIREYSDILIMFLLKGRAPHKYKERFSGELSGPGGKPIESKMEVIHVTSPVPLAEDEEDIQT